MLAARHYDAVHGYGNDTGPIPKGCLRRARRLSIDFPHHDYPPSLQIRR